MLKSLEETAPHYEVLLYLDEQDPSAKDYRTDVKVFYGQDQSTIKSWNFLAAQCSGSLLMVGSDDILFRTKGWDNRLFAAIPYDGIAVFGFNDGRGNGNPHPVVTRRWYETLGYLGPAGFYHWYIDTWNNTLAQKIGRYCYMPDVLVEHCHAKAGKAENDETYQRIRRDNTQIRDHAAWVSNKHLLEQEAQKLASLCHGDGGVFGQPSQ